MCTLAPLEEGGFRRPALCSRFPLAGRPSDCREPVKAPRVFLSTSHAGETSNKDLVISLITENETLCNYAIEGNPISHPHIEETDIEGVSLSYCSHWSHILRPFRFKSSNKLRPEAPTTSWQP